MLGIQNLRDSDCTPCKEVATGKQRESVGVCGPIFDELLSLDDDLSDLRYLMED